jgi:hypothetical protein
MQRPVGAVMAKMLRLSPAELATHQAWKDREAGNEAAKPLRLTRPVEPESSVLTTVLKALLMHRRVAFAHRMNAGAGKFLYPDGSTSQFIRFGFAGMADISGQTVDGKRLEVEVKAAGKDPTADQIAFLERVNRHGGIGFVARGVADVIRELGPA